MDIALIGCGFVADFYMQSLDLYPELRLCGIFDRDDARARAFAAHHGIATVYPDLDTLLSDARIGMVLNLTNPRSHYAVSRACLEAGKHVYSEKPLAMQMDEAHALVALAREKGLELASAPCSLLGETAQTFWRALRERRVGDVRLVYAEMDDGMVFKAPYEKWRSASGAAWPFKDEFEIGCTLEHAGYYTTWLTAFFGPAESVTAFSSCLYPDKITSNEHDAADFSVACIRFHSGVVARLTCSIVAPHDQRLRAFGTEGLLYTDFSWNYRQPVKTRRMLNIRRRQLFTPWSRRLPLADAGVAHPRGRHAMHFCRGPAAVAAAIRDGRRSPLPIDFCLHNNEIVLAIQNATEHSQTVVLSTSFAPLQPQPWAR
jgi:predicted dehydrogenase